ncbi:hypothetical protein J7E89_36115 [Streptomyces sp. ISL-100]|nr:hypothetical protein [Streptomyces sp. ISL-100]
MEARAASAKSTEKIDEQRVSQPGLVVLDITAADEATVHAVMAGLGEWWATAGVAPVRREPGVPGVKARIYADIRRPGTMM